MVLMHGGCMGCIAWPGGAGGLLGDLEMAIYNRPTARQTEREGGGSCV